MNAALALDLDGWNAPAVCSPARSATLCILFHRLGPYHWARLDAAAELGAVCGIEVSAITSEYAWDKMDGARRFRRMTLFEDDRACAKQLVDRVYCALDECGPTAVAVPGWSHPAALVALQWCVETSTPAILMSESNRFDERRYWWKERMKRAVVSLCAAGLVGGTSHAEYLTALGLPKERIFTGYNVVDNEWFAPRAAFARDHATQVRRHLQLPEKYFLASKRFIPKKNIRGLLEAYSAYLDKAGSEAWKLVLLGDGPLKPQVIQMREELGLREHVLLPGFKQYADLPAYYGLASMFIHASSVEQWGLVVNEAMASGLPVLVSNRCGCARALVIESKNGFTFDPFDTPGLTELMLKASSGDYNLLEMGNASREIIAALSPQQFADGLGQALDCALSRPRRPVSLFAKTVLQALIHRRTA